MTSKSWLKPWGMFLALVAYATCFSNHKALATRPALWSNAFLVQTTNSIVNPALLVGFNPQPEPPAWTGEMRSAIVGGAIEQTVTEISNPAAGLQNFQFLFAVASDAGPLLVSYPPDPINDFRIGFSVSTPSAKAGFTAFVEVQSSSGGVIAPGSELMFNPQPEPPALGFGDWFTFGLDFGVTSLSDVTLRLRVEDSQGSHVNLRPVPEPTTPSLLITALLTGNCIVGRRRRFGVCHTTHL